MNKILLAGVLILACDTALAVESTFKLMEGPGLDKVQANCSACHSLDYIQLNSTFLDRKGWDATVTKMIKALGAPVKPEDIKAIVDYLTRNYGKE
jgi:mono/diheme cytochrome c family protein